MSTSPIQGDAADADDSVGDLVAYLDGELSDDDCRRVERRLANDADYRRRLTELEQAWSALDVLPLTVVADDFSRTTIEMVCVAAERDVKQESVAHATAGRQRTLGMIAAGLAFALAAFAATWFLAPSRDRALVADLPVVAQFEVLSEVGDIDFLRGLSKLDLEPTARGTAAEVTAVSTADWDTVADRRQWIESLRAGEKAELAAKFERFEREATPEARDRFRKLEQDIATAPDHKRLAATLAEYGVWLQSRTQGEKLGLRDRTLSTQERLRKVERLLEESQRAQRRQLSFEDEKALQDAILSIVDQRRHELVNQVRERGIADAEQRIGRLSANQVALVIIGRDMQDEGRRRRLQDRLTARLSDDARSYLDGLEEWQRGRQLGRWVFDALAPKIGPQNLEQFFAEELTDDQRESLLGLPRTEMEEQLQQMFMRSQVGLRDEGLPRWLWGGGPGGRGPRGGERGRGDRDRRDGPGRNGPGRDFDGDRFDGPPPGRRGPGGPDGFGRPGGPPGPRRDWGPPPRDGERPFGPPPPPPREDGPPPDGPRPEEPS